jgi:hypothetical protein
MDPEDGKPGFSEHLDASESLRELRMLRKELDCCPLVEVNDQIGGEKGLELRGRLLPTRDPGHQVREALNRLHPVHQRNPRKRESHILSEPRMWARVPRIDLKLTPESRVRSSSRTWRTARGCSEKPWPWARFGGHSSARLPFLVSRHSCAPDKPIRTRRSEVICPR